jgi:hypothetical protein
MTIIALWGSDEVDKRFLGTEGCCEPILGRELDSSHSAVVVWCD